MRTKFI